MTVPEPNAPGPSGDARDLAYREIRRLITERHYRPGSPLREVTLSKAIGVSRTPIRAALVRLAAEGLVETIPNRGAFVAQWTTVDLEEIFGLRIELESYGARLAAAKITDEQLAELGDLADQMDAALAEQAPGYIDVCTELNNAFHFAVLRAGTNRRLVTLLTGVYELPLLHRTISTFTTEQLTRSWSQHRELIAAFQAGDGDWASAVMRGHILAARSITISRQVGAHRRPGASERS